MRTHGITLERALESYRPRVVRLCARLSGSSEGAEELAQETLIEAWRNRHKLERGEVSFAWLSRIAQFVVRRWFRQRDRAWRREQPFTEVEAETLYSEDTGTLERDELAVLLDRALTKLPERTRTLLHRSYWEGQSLQELAERERITPANAAVRLWRGRTALQQAVRTHFPEEARAYGLVSAEQSDWQETPIWCANCAQHRLLVHRGEGEVTYRCPQCHPDARLNSHLVFLRGELPTGPLPGHRVLLRRLTKQLSGAYLPAVSGGQSFCHGCHCALIISSYTPLSAYPTLRDRYGLMFWCEHCQKYVFAATLGRFYMGLPEVQQFWSRYPRLRRKTEEDVVVGGLPAIRIPFESALDSSRLDILVRRDNFQLLRVERE